MITDADRVRDMMNRCGADGTPFLFAVNFELTEGLLIERPLRQRDVLFRVQGVTNGISHDCLDLKPLAADPIPFDEYRRRFDIVMKGLMRGDSFLTNLTVRTSIAPSNALKSLFLATRSPYGLYVPGRFACFSPERFVRLGQGIISTTPMKGTINADTPHAESALLDNLKEMSEHNTIVDLLRNDLGMIARDVSVEKFRYIDRIDTVNGAILQTSSEIIGRLAEDCLSKLGDLIFTMLPAGSVSGAPKKSTVNLIRCAEVEPRGYYCGVFGYFNGATLDSGVLIRFVEERDGRQYFRSGGGITVNSNPHHEYREVIDKINLPI